MAIEIKEIALEASSIKKFVKFGISLYRGNDCYVPPLVMDDVNTLRPDKNPAFEFCKAKCWMAYRDGRPVGRIAGIINKLVNERSQHRTVRFGFVDFIDDEEVVDALFAVVEDWGRSEGMESITGPMGFTDLDHEGMLVDGFKEVGTMATIYNYDYYPKHMERMGFVSDAEWVEFRIEIPDSVPEKMARIAEIVRKKYGLRTIKFTDRKKLEREYGIALFELINKAYDKLYGYSPLTPKQIKYYIDIYLPVLKLDNVSVIVDAENKLVGVGITIPSLSRALQRSKGRMLPFGWIHLLKALMGRNDTVDLLLVAISPEYQGKGVNSLLFADLVPVFVKSGYRWAESNPELADNDSVQLQWQYFSNRQHRRRRAYTKKI